ncbi:glycoside hydrolase family 32 protein [Gluconobacter wancherniae]|uniref:glycoside hydrolase family 32 protein n=1 Tax=Gluconobacter wancherniae TaxID=1307955 RepID=UPI001B8D254C|nr:glycoside hydrolase family 32 protein [Gluconobacter wancherniae]MBS1089787.1 GH32 C-terminal domain-containing protein [Gluconobacter wancherniae]
MTDREDRFSLGRRKALTSLLAAGTFVGTARTARADVAPGDPSGRASNEKRNQPNNSHAEPANQPGANMRPVIKTQSDYFYRPSIHFSPVAGFMNDPNGLIFDGQYFHLYYQYDPTAPYAGRVHWGHAISTDLYSWQDQPIAIDQTAAGEAYSGCVVMDRENVSGLFPQRPSTAAAAVRSGETSLPSADVPAVSSAPSATQAAVDALSPMLRLDAPDAPPKDQAPGPTSMQSTGQPVNRSPLAPPSPDSLPVLGEPNSSALEKVDIQASESVPPAPAKPTAPPIPGGLVAIYTRATPQKQTQYIAWSPDGGQHFMDYAHNPILDIGRNSFRDPKVFWHEQSQKWVMVVVKAREHKVAFYGSIDLMHWMHLSDFGPAGLFGVDYECPNLIELKVEDRTNGTRWVLFVSVNPGGPQGGSITQYFVGDFDGERFQPEDTVIGLTDFAKDSYAMQVYNDMPNGAATYFAWFGNWQYCEEVPNRSWRGLMTVPRDISLRHDEAGWLRLVQRPRGLEALRGPEIPFPVGRIAAQSGAQVAIPPATAIEFSLTVTVDERPNAQPDGVQGRAGRFIVAFSNSQGETLTIGFDAFSSQLWLDRGELNGFSQPFFTERFSTPLTADSRRFSLHIVLDACALEIFANDGMSVGTALVFPANPLDTLSLQATNAGATVQNVKLYPLRKTMNRQTAM